MHSALTMYEVQINYNLKRHWTILQLRLHRIGYRITKIHREMPEKNEKN